MARKMQTGLAMLSGLVNRDFVSPVMPQKVLLEDQVKIIIKIASKRLWSMEMEGDNDVGRLYCSRAERPGACSGLRSGAWPWKRNNGKLGAFN